MELSLPRVLGMVLAGHTGARLMPLTRERAKPAIPFGGNYRLIDFSLSNLANAGIRRIAVLTQYKSHSLDRHIAQTWRLSPLFHQYVMSIPAQMRTGHRWYEGSADAIYQNLNLLRDEHPDYLVVVGGDHVCRFDPRQVLDAHRQSGAGVTLVGLRIARTEASHFGVIWPGPNHRIIGFQEKPVSAEGLPDDPEQVFASAGMYVFTRQTLEQAVRADADHVDSAHDLGANIIPMLVNAGDAAVYDYAENQLPGATEDDRGYWNHVDTLDAYYQAQMDLTATRPALDLYNEEWPIYCQTWSLPPAKFLVEGAGRRGAAYDSMVCHGAIVAGGEVRRSVLSSKVRVDAAAVVEDSVLMDDVHLGRGAVVRRAIIDKNVDIPPGVTIGVDRDEDRARGFVTSESGVVCIGKGDRLSDAQPGR